ncbi:hypothetical protein [Vibrio sp. WXL103]|uniref:hypothetical protein n=1 Tax=Vibrio sp. WXL103 TaxID=3450710 RepID=UPI003EC64B98
MIDTSGLRKLKFSLQELTAMHEKGELHLSLNGKIVDQDKSSAVEFAKLGLSPFIFAKQSDDGILTLISELKFVASLLEFIKSEPENPATERILSLKLLILVQGN